MMIAHHREYYRPLSAELSLLLGIAARAQGFAGSDMTEFSGKLPVWYQLAMLLRADILHGVLAPESRIESEVQFAQKHGVSVMPVRQAFRSLEAEGLITRQRGRGTFVKKRPAHSGSTSLASLYAKEFDRDAILLERGTVAVPPPFKAAFGDQAQLGYIRRVAFRDERPWSYGTLYFLPEFDALIPSSLLRRFPLYRLMEEQCGVQVKRSHFEARASAATPEVAAHLRVDPFTPVLDLAATSYDATGRAIGAFQMAFISDPYVFSFETTHGDDPKETTG